MSKEHMLTRPDDQTLETCTWTTPSFTRKLRVMIIEDSRTVREFLSHIINHDPRLEVVAAVETGEAALCQLHQAAPDVISMDIRLPGIDGFETTRRIMSERPTPIVVIAASVEAEDLRISMRALQAGALSVLEKPACTARPDYEAIAARLCTHLATMSQVKVVTQRQKRNPPRFGPLAARSLPFLRTQGAFRVLGIVASTGGPNALVALLGDLPANFPVPILLVQHITASFMKGFVDWLATTLPLRVRKAEPGEVPEPGSLYVAPADRHLRLHKGCFQLDGGPLNCMQRPSGTVLFESMAADLGSRALGVLLTGMGQDGAEGLLAIRRAGGYTITEDASTAVVYGMPGAALALGASCESLPLQLISPRIRQLVSPEPRYGSSSSYPTR